MSLKTSLIQNLEAATGSAGITDHLYSFTRTSRVLAIAQNPDRVQKITNLIQSAAQANGGIDQFKKTIDNYAAKDQSFMSWTTANRQARIYTSWLAVVQTYKPEVTMEDVFRYSIVKEHILKFLPVMVKIMKPLKGHTVIRSSTLHEAFSTFVSLIIQLTYDDEGIKKKGFELLTTGGAFMLLQDQLSGLIHDHKLDRTPRMKFYFGREHVHILLSTMLTQTEMEPGQRATAIQSMARLLLSFYATCCPSTLDYTEKMWRDAGRFPKQKHVRIYRRGYMDYVIEIELINFKGAISTVNADQQFIKLHPVLWAHNALFDPTVAFIALFFVHQDFKTKYKTIEEFCNDDSAEILLDPAKAEAALFQKLSEGGKSFVSPPEPSSSASASSTLSWWCELAGLPKQGVTALRRDAGNMYGQQMGMRVARVIMNHREERDVFQKHYSRTTNNLQLVNLRLGEIKGSKESKEGETLENNQRLHLFTETVIEHMVRFKDN